MRKEKLSPLNNINGAILCVTRPNLIYNRKKAICTFISIWFFFVCFCWTMAKQHQLFVCQRAVRCFVFPFFVLLFSFFCGIIGALTIQCLTIFHLDRLSLSGMIVSVTLVSVFNVRLIAFDHRFLSAFFVYGLVFFETQFLLRQTWWSQLMNSKLFL